MPPIAVTPQHNRAAALAALPRQQLRNIRRDPRVTLSVESDVPWKADHSTDPRNTRGAVTCERRESAPLSASRLDRPGEAAGPFGLIDFLSERTHHFACDLSPHLRHRTSALAQCTCRVIGAAVYALDRTSH